MENGPQLKRYYVYDKSRGVYLEDSNGMKIITEGGNEYLRKSMDFDLHEVKDGRNPYDSFATYYGGFNVLD